MYITALIVVWAISRKGRKAPPPGFLDGLGVFARDMLGRNDDRRLYNGHISVFRQEGRRKTRFFFFVTRFAREQRGSFAAFPAGILPLRGTRWFSRLSSFLIILYEHPF